jgi:hypothetical protein
MNGDPGREQGARVERSGIALVHEGEYIAPAPSGQAVVTPWAAATERAVNYSFPVEIEVVGDLTEAQRDALATYVFDELAAALDSRA